MKYYYCEQEKKLINLEDIINNNLVPESVIETSKKVYEYIDNAERQGIYGIDINKIQSSGDLDPLRAGGKDVDPLRAGSKAIDPSPNIIKAGDGHDKMVMFFFNSEKYRRGSVYTAIQISFNHNLRQNDYRVKCYSNPYEKCNVSIKIYCTDTVLHSSVAFGTTPSIKECQASITRFYTNHEFLYSMIYKAFYHFCLQ